MSLPASTKAVIFDMDGVLWLSSPNHARAYREALERVNVFDFEYAQYAGMRTVECLERVFEERGITITEATIAELAEEKNRLAVESLRRDPPVSPGCGQVLSRLRAKYRLALATSASPNTMEVFLEASGSRALFSILLCGRSVERPKPAPDIYLKAAELLGVEPGCTVVVEDAVAGVQAGKSAGAQVWALPTTSAAADLMAAGADRVIESLEGLL
ncbi:MAG: HAD-IA family hydrolase [Candidatus Solibacter sp.]|jgi:beta-phosphoglucomutase